MAIFALFFCKFGAIVATGPLIIRLINQANGPCHQRIFMLPRLGLGVSHTVQLKVIDYLNGCYIGSDLKKTSGLNYRNYLISELGCYEPINLLI